MQNTNKLRKIALLIILKSKERMILGWLFMDPLLCNDNVSLILVILNNDGLTLPVEARKWCICCS